MPVKNVFLSKVKEIITGMNDSFVEELRSITGPKRVFPMKAECGKITRDFVRTIEKTYDGCDRPKFPTSFPYQYNPFSSRISEYGIVFDQKLLVEEAAILFSHIRSSFCDQRDAADVATDAIMVVFWANLLVGYFEHRVESELYRNNLLHRTSGDYSLLSKEGDFDTVLTNMKLAFAFRNLPLISTNARLPNGNPFDYQWVCRYYLRRKIDGFGGNAMDYVGETRWFDGLEKLIRALSDKENYQPGLKYFALQGLDDLHNIPVYLISGSDMPAFSTTLKSTPRTLEDVLRETKDTNQKFFREILHLVEFSFDLSVNLDHDVGLAIEAPDSTPLLELFPRTYTHSYIASFCDLICLPASVAEAIREEGKEELIKELILSGFEMETSGKMILILSEKIGWKHWNQILACIRKILKI